jgi:hypothetical protein
MRSLKEKHKLRIFENRVLRRIFGPKEQKVTSHNEKHHNLYHLPNIIIRAIKSRRSEMNWMFSTYWDVRNVDTILVTKAEGVRPFGRCRWRRVNNIKMNLR